MSSHSYSYGTHNHGITGGSTYVVDSIYKKETILPLDANVIVDKIWSNLGNTQTVKLEDRKYMETLYNVIVVDKDRTILLDEKTVAKNEETAKFNVEVYTYLRENALTLDDVTVICYKLGYVEVDEDLK